MPIPDNFQKILSLADKERVTVYTVPGKFSNSLRLKRDRSGIWLPFEPSYSDASPDLPLLILVIRHFSSEYFILSHGYLAFLHHVKAPSPTPFLHREYQARRKKLDLIVRFLDYLFFDFLNLLESGATYHLDSLFNSRILFKVGPEFKEWKSGSTFSSLESLARRLVDKSTPFRCLHQFKDTFDPETFHEFLPLGHVVLFSKPELILPGMITGKI